MSTPSSRDVQNPRDETAVGVVIGFYPGRGRASNVRVAGVGELQQVDGKSVYALIDGLNLPANKKATITWQDGGAAVFPQTIELIYDSQKESFLPGSTVIDSVLKEVGDFQTTTGNWREWIEKRKAIDGDARYRQRRFFYDIERMVHPEAAPSSIKTNATTLREWLDRRDINRAICAKEGRPLNSTLHDREQAQRQLTKARRDAAVTIHDWIMGLVDELVAPDSQASPADTLSSAFDAFCLGCLRYKDSEYGIPDSPQVSLFAEMAICFYELGLSPGFWKSVLPAFVRGVVIFNATAWKGGARSSLRAYTAERYLLHHEPNPYFDADRLFSLRKQFRLPKAAGNYEQAQLEYRLGCITHDMLFDDYGTYVSSLATNQVQGALTAGVKTHLFNLAQSPFTFSDPVDPTDIVDS